MSFDPKCHALAEAFRQIQAPFFALSGLAFAVLAATLMLQGDMQNGALWMIAALLTRAPSPNQEGEG
jgi:hypothetical protein